MARRATAAQEFESDPALAARIDSLLAERRRKETNRFRRWRDDPEGFIEQALLFSMWSKQREIARSVARNRRTAVQSCHDVGKDWIAAQIIAWWEACNDPGAAFAVTLAPTAAQVKTILWRELQRSHAAGGLPGRLNQTEWWIGDEIVGIGRSPDDYNPTSIQGIHQERVLVVLDEAGGISHAIADAADSLIANESSRALAIGNPDDPSSWFASICKPGSGWNVVKISAFDSPNFTGEAIPERLKNLLVSKTWVEEKRKSWGESSPLWFSKVLGEFPEQATDSLVPISALAAAHKRWEALPKGEDGRPVVLNPKVNDLGVDVARMGDDKTVFYRRKDAVAYKEHEHSKRDLMELVGQVVRLCRKDKPRRIKIDDNGMGGGVTDRLREMQAIETPGSPSEAEAKEALRDVDIVPINVGEGASTDAADERFKNKRAELNWNVRTLLTAADATAAIEPDDSLDAQATQIKYKVLSSGEIQIEPKADMKKRTKGVSPDHWDAFVLCEAEPSFSGAGLLEYYRRLAEQAEKGAPPSPFGAAKEPGKTSRLKVPAGTSAVYGMTGVMYQVTDGAVDVAEEDVGPLIALGFVRIT